jgi:hypothetical protein
MRVSATCIPARWRATTSPGTQTTKTITPGWRRATAGGSSTRVAARLWLYDPSSGTGHVVAVELGSPRTQRQPRFVAADRYLSDYQLDKTGKRLVLNTLGKLFCFAPFDGPVVQPGSPQGVRYRLSSFLGSGADIVTVSDASGFEAIEVHRAWAGPAMAASGSPLRPSTSPASGESWNSSRRPTGPCWR